MTLLDSRELGVTLDDVAGIGNRFTGTPGEVTFRDYIVARFRQAGLASVSMEGFECLAYEPIESRCAILGLGDGELQCNPLQYSANAEVRATAVYLGDASPADLARIERAGVDLRGKVVAAHCEYAFDLAPVLAKRGIAALIHMGESPDGLIPSSNAVMYPPPLQAPWAGRPLPYPAVSISLPAGRRLLSTLSLGAPVEVTVAHRSRLRPTTAHNVVGEIPGAGGETVILCAHYDSQAEGPAVYDNGTGVASLLEIARLLAGSRPRRRIVCLASAAEEIGLWGATAYTLAHARELPSAVAMINLDGVASSYPSRREIWSADARLRRLATETARRSGWTPDRVVPERGTFSDHVPFSDAGVPACLIWRPEYPYLVSRGDIRSLVDEEAVAETAGVSYRLTRRLANDPAPLSTGCEIEVKA
ncbi:MAG TPA: M28 family metallopeptidase [Solirubrobacteraceae bacterium]|nr:M28 family metallopeptidase [Solirubrobacteraceae bacterium]